METESLPIACLLTAPGLQEQRGTVLQKFRGAVIKIKELEGGYSCCLYADSEWLSK